MSYKIGKEYHFSAAHMIPEHPKCGRMHGHNYRVLVVLESELLTMPQNWVVDFGVLDEIVKPLVAALDHHFIRTQAMEVGEGKGWVFRLAARDDIVDLPIKSSSAESLAGWFYKEVSRATENWLGISVRKVTVWETDKAAATYGMP